MSENQLDPSSTAKPHAFTGLFAGDYFIHRFDVGDHVFIAYGFLRSIKDGKYYAEYPFQKRPLSKPGTIEKEDHKVIGRITKQAYALAKIRNWPNDESGVAAIIDYAAGRPVILSLNERIRLFFSRLS
jgi:hypothetical protein